MAGEQRRYEAERTAERIEGNLGMTARRRQACRWGKAHRSSTDRDVAADAASTRQGSLLETSLEEELLQEQQAAGQVAQTQKERAAATSLAPE